MSIHSDFPLLASDQAEVIQIYLELMREKDCAEQASNISTKRPSGPLNDLNDSLFLDESSDLP